MSLGCPGDDKTGNDPEAVARQGLAQELTLARRRRAARWIWRFAYFIGSRFSRTDSEIRKPGSVRTPRIWSSPMPARTRALTHRQSQALQISCLHVRVLSLAVNQWMVDCLGLRQINAIGSEEGLLLIFACSFGGKKIINKRVCFPEKI